MIQNSYRNRARCPFSQKKQNAEESFNVAKFRGEILSIFSIPMIQLHCRLSLSFFFVNENGRIVLLKLAVRAGLESVFFTLFDYLRSNFHQTLFFHSTKKRTAYFCNGFEQHMEGSRIISMKTKYTQQPLFSFFITPSQKNYIFLVSD